MLPTTLTSPLAGIYLHWPFCARKCPYCDFYTFGREHPDFTLHERFADALLAEIDAAPRRLDLPDRPAADTIYFGGGTPSLIPPDTLRAILDRLRDRFNLAPNSEITLEVNPTAAEAAQFEAFASLGVNRLSIGCQSFNDRFLRTLGRDHDAAQAREAVARARAAGFNNLSLDLMFGLPDQTLPEFLADIDALLAFDPEHISAYGLTYHPGTPFDRWRRQNKWAYPESDPEGDMFEALMDRMDAAGYEQYEISNFRKPDRGSRHNAKYWSAADVFAFGPSAHGVIAGRRYSNARDLRAYVDAWSSPSSATSPPTVEFLENAGPGEVMMLALRRTAGVDWSELDAWLGFDARARYAVELADLCASDLLHPDTHGLRLTRRGILLADAVAERFI